MKRHEQALLFLRKAAQDEALLDAVIDSANVADEVFGFHRQQAAEKMLKALLSMDGDDFRKIHDLRALMDKLVEIRNPLSPEFETLDALTPFAVVYRYEDFDSGTTFDRNSARTMLRTLRSWCEEHIGAHRE